MENKDIKLDTKGNTGYNIIVDEEYSSSSKEVEGTTVSIWKFIVDIATMSNQSLLDEEYDNVALSKTEQRAQDALECCANCRYLSDHGATGASCTYSSNQVMGRWGLECDLTSSITETENFIYTHKCQFFKGW